MTNLETIQAALAAARQNAGNAVANVDPGSAGGAVATVTPSRPITLREQMAMGSSMSVKAYLKVDRVAFLLGKDDKLFEEFTVEFRPSQVKPFFGVRYGSSPARYERSYDRVVNARNGQPWANTVAQAQQVDPRCRGDYLGVDVPFTLCEDVKGKAGAVIASKGEAIGWTSSITNYYDWRDFYAPFLQLIDSGVLSENALLRGKIVHVKRKGKEDYGALTFVDFDVVDDGLGQAAEAA